MDTGLGENTFYIYRVYELLFDQNFPELRENRQLTLPFGGYTLARLANGRAEAISQTQMRITWDGAGDPNTLGFLVRRSTSRIFLGDCGMNPETVIAETPGSVNQVIDVGLHSNSVYYYDICHVDMGLNTSRLENTFVGKTMNMDPNGDGMVDSQDLLWILDTARKDENSQAVLIEFALEWVTEIAN